MLNIRGMSMVENFLTGVNRFGQGLTFALTREQKEREAPLLRVGVERVVRRHWLPPAINNAKQMARQNDHLLGFRCVIYGNGAMRMRVLVRTNCAGKQMR